MTSREISIPKVIIGLAVVMLISVAGSGAETPTRLTEVAVSATNDATYVVVTTGGRAKYHATLVDPHRLVVDFEDTRYQWRTTPFPGSGDPIAEIRGSQFKKDVARLVVQLSRRSRYTIETDANGIVIVLNHRGERPANLASPKALGDQQPVVIPIAAATSFPAMSGAPLSQNPPPGPALTSAPVRLAQAQAPTPPPAPPSGTITATNG